MNILGYRFKPKIWTIVLMMFFVAVFSSLGRWQMSRADEKNIKHEQMQLYAKQPPINLPPVLIKLEDFKYRDIEVHGEFLNNKTIFLDNKMY